MSRSDKPAPHQVTMVSEVFSADDVAKCFAMAFADCPDIGLVVRVAGEADDGDDEEIDNADLPYYGAPGWDYAQDPWPRTAKS